MNLTFRATSPADYSKVRDFLASTFRSNPDDPGLQRSQLQWKYWDPRLDWDGSRSYVLERGDNFVAHLAVWPLTYKVGAASIRAVQLVDWAANPGTGVGTRLLSNVARLVDFVIGVGGSYVGRRMMPKLGFSPAGEYKQFARPLRPFHQALSHQRRGWRVPIRMARNLLRSFSGVRVSLAWKAVPASPTEVQSWPESRSDAIYPCRSVSFYQYVLRCPTADCQFFTIRQAGRYEGYFCLTSVPGQARITEMWLESDNPAVWAIGYALASREAVVLGASEIVAASSSKLGSRGLVAAGYTLCETMPIWARAANGGALPELQIAMVDHDGFFLHHGAPEYMT